MRRRKFIGSIGAFTAYGVIGKAGAKENQTESEKAFASELTEAYLDDGEKGLKSAYNERNLDHTIESAEHNSSKVGDKEDASDTSVSPNNNYDKDKSKLYTVISESSDGTDRVWASVTAELKNQHSDYQPALAMADAIGISFNGSHWSVVGGKSLAASCSNDDDDKQPEASWHSQSLTDGGLAAKVDLASKEEYIGPDLPDKTVVTIQSELRNLDGVPGNIFGTYVHTGGNGSIDSISGGLGPISLGISGTLAKEHFDIAEPADPAEYL